MKRRNCRGQMYLIAVIIIIGLFGSLITVMNYSRKEKIPEVYHLGEELNIEASNLLDYAILNEFTEIQTKDLMGNFIANYTIYGEIEKLYFIFGKPDNITFFGYSELKENNVTIKINETEIPISIDPKELKEETIGNIGIGAEIEIISEDSTSKFVLREGENFYFVLSQEIDNEKFVVQGGNVND